MLELKHCQKNVRGLKTSWLKAGAEEADTIVVFLHGFPDGPEAFADIQKVFAKDHLTIAPFVRGCGESEPSLDLGRYRLDSLVLDVLDLLKTVDPTCKKKIILVAHDLGVPLAWRLRFSLGTRLRAAVMINGLSLGQMCRRWKRPAQHVKSWYIYALQVPMLSRFLFGHFPQPIRKWMLAQGGYREKEELSVDDSRLRLVDPSQQYRAFLKDSLTEARFSPSKRLGAPVLVLWGKEDSFLLPPNLDELEFDAEKIEVRIVEGDHWFFREKPRDVCNMISSFLQSQN